MALSQFLSLIRVPFIPFNLCPCSGQFECQIFYLPFADFAIKIHSEQSRLGSTLKSPSSFVLFLLEVLVLVLPHLLVRFWDRLFFCLCAINLLTKEGLLLDHAAIPAPSSSPRPSPSPLSLSPPCLSRMRCFAVSMHSSALLFAHKLIVRLSKASLHPHRISHNAQLAHPAFHTMLD